MPVSFLTGIFYGFTSLKLRVFAFFIVAFIVMLASSFLGDYSGFRHIMELLILLTEGQHSPIMLPNINL